MKTFLKRTFKRLTSSGTEPTRLGCLANHTRTDSFTSETSDEEVDYGSFGIDANPHTDSDHAWSTHQNDRVGKKTCFIRVY